MNCSVIVKGTKVDGIYDKDPKNNKDAKFFKEISYLDVLSKNLRVMDSTAISLAKESKIPIIITNLNVKNSIWLEVGILKCSSFNRSCGTNIHYRVNR